MTTNILKAIQNLVAFGRNDLARIYSGPNRINNVGSALEYYVKDIFCGTLDLGALSAKDRAYRDFLSYRGNLSSPPDFIIEGGDAVEVKKIGGLKTDILLNSSYPKAKLYSNSPMITRECRACESGEGWNEKDIIYVIGSVVQKKIKLLWMVYGDCYAAGRETYEGLKSRISSDLNKIPGVDFSPTKELGRVNKVDPLGITYLRIRGMWGIAHPTNVFKYVAEIDRGKTFSLIAIMRTEKYDSFPAKDRRAIEALSCEGVSVSDIEIMNPGNPARFLSAKLIRFEMN